MANAVESNGHIKNGPSFDLSTLTVEQVNEWLQSKHVTLWSDWDIAREDRRSLAAEWFLGETTSLIDFLESQLLLDSDI